MPVRKRWSNTLGIYIFFIGLLLGMFTTALFAWADFEASRFDSHLDSQAAALDLRCPILINRHETGTVSATLANPTDRERRRIVDTLISQGSFLLAQEERDRLDLEPGEKRILHWEVSPENAVWERFILVRAHVLRNAPLPARTSSCGILVVNLPYGTGTQIALSLIAVILLLIGSGTVLWLIGKRSLRQRLRPIDFMTLAVAPIVLVALGTSMLGQWLISGLLLLLAILIIVSVLSWSLR